MQQLTCPLYLCGVLTCPRAPYLFIHCLLDLIAWWRMIKELSTRCLVNAPMVSGMGHIVPPMTG